MRAIMVALLAATAAPAAGAVSVQPLAGEASWLEGSGCNVVIVPSRDGLLLVDDQRPNDYAETRAALDQAFHLPVAKVIDTHWHLDHAGGNARFAGVGALIIAQKNVGVRLAAPQYMSAYKILVPASPAAALPRQSFDARLTFSFGNEIVRLIHVPHAHTDGDTLVQLVHANVIHMGDVFFNGIFPFIDLDSGGSIQGLIRAVDVALRRSDAQSLIVPGHGPLAHRADLVAYRTMLATVSADVGHHIASGQDLAAILTAKPAASYKLEGDADRFVAAVYAGHVAH